MDERALYNRWRPVRFADVVGQDRTGRALREAVAAGTLSHAHLLSGPHGTGKTTFARILAAVLNCERPAGGDACGTCGSCLDVQTGRSPHVIELDAAVNSGVDAARKLVEGAMLGSGGHKVYVLDECHSLTAQASNALLKLIEEPPPHVSFVFATTNPGKMLPTVRSRCEQHTLRSIPDADLDGHLRKVAADEGLAVDDAAFGYVVARARGSARDALQLLGTIAVAGMPELSAGGDPAVLIVDAVAQRDPAVAVEAVDAAIDAGEQPFDLAARIVDHLERVFLRCMGVDRDLPDETRTLVETHAIELRAAGATRALETLFDMFATYTSPTVARSVLTVTLVKLAAPEQ